MFAARVLLPMREKLEAAPEPLWLLALGAAWLGVVAVSLGLCGSGFVHPEIYSFLPHYLSGQPFFEIITDNRVTDWGHYQARDLSFVFDYADCQFIDWCWRHGHPHFFSAMHYLLLLAAGLALWRVATRYCGVSRLLAFALVLLLWSGPSVMLYTAFYRVAKMGLLLATLLAAWAWFRARAPRAGGARVALFGVTAVLLPMFDKQGLIFLGALVLFLARQALVHQTPRERRLFFSSVAALALAWCYQRFLGPWMIAHIHHYEIERDYASVPLAQLLAQPRFLATVVGGAPVLAFDSFRFPLGNLPFGLALLAAWWMQREIAARPAPASVRTGWRRVLAPRWLFPALAALVGAVYAAMLMLFPLIFSSEHRRFFYGLPVTALWFLAAAVALGACARRRPDLARWLELAVFALVAGNLFALPEHRFVLRHGHYASFCENAARLRWALRPENIAHAGVPPAQAAALLTDAPYYFDAVPPSLDKDRLFLFFLSRASPAP